MNRLIERMYNKIITIIHEYNHKRQFNVFEKKLKELSKDLSAEGLVELLFSERAYKLFWPKQVKEELLMLVKVLVEIKPQNIVEIGTAGGGTLFIMTKLAQDNAKVMSIYLPQGRFGGGYPEWKSKFYSSFANKTQQIKLLRSDSHQQATFNECVQFFGNSKLDVLFIDGDHTYEGVKQDYELYKPLVRDGGIIVFHDIVLHPKNAECEVQIFWEEIKQDYEYEELVHDWDQKWAGIGVLKNVIN